LKPIPIVETESSLPRPMDYLEPVRGLEIYDAFKCNIVDCKYLTRNTDMIKRHYRDHRLHNTVTESSSHEPRFEHNTALANC
jgi:hypothetical protein